MKLDTRSSRHIRAGVFMLAYVALGSSADAEGLARIGVSAPGVGCGDAFHGSLPHLADLQASGQHEDAAAGRTSLHLPLVWVDGTQDGAPVFARMAREVESIMGRMGVEVSWREDALGGEVHENEIRVILISSYVHPAPEQRHVMGSVQRASDRARATWIRLRNVLQALDLKLQSESIWSPIERKRVGQALGRVVAHELVHLIDPTLDHTASGLMSPSMSRRLLVRGSMSISSHTRESVRAALLDPLASSPRDPASVTAAAEPTASQAARAQAPIRGR